MTHHVLSVAAAAILFAVPASGQDWTTIALGTTDDILMIENTAFNERWITGENGYAAQSSASRTIWTQVNVGVSDDLLSVSQPSSGQVWVGAGSGSVRLKSGVDWLIRDIPSSAEDFKLFTRSSGAMWAIGSAGSIYRTADLGMNWSLKWSAGLPLHDGSGFIDGPAYAVGDGGTALKTTDAGVTWTTLPTGTTADLHGFIEGGQGTGLLAVGESGTIIHSLDGGTTWNPLPSGTNATLYDVSSSKQNSSWLVAVGEAGTILKSTDAGQTWCHLIASTLADLYCVEALTNSEYLVGGENGLLLRTTSGGGPCAAVGVETGLPGAQDLILAGPFPHPVVSTSFLTLETGAARDVAVDLCDVAGRRVVTLLRRSCADGEKVFIPLEARGLSSGAYFVRVLGGSGPVTRKVLVAR
jgi:photosystem II stability/assembly factor-like uncharacterized protein